MRRRGFADSASLKKSAIIAGTIIAVLAVVAIVVGPIVAVLPVVAVEAVGPAVTAEARPTKSTRAETTAAVGLKHQLVGCPPLLGAEGRIERTQYPYDAFETCAPVC
jgi:hypothetical protein